MARVDVKMPDEFLEHVRLGSNFDSIAETVLQAGGEVVLAKTQSNLSSVIGSSTKYDSRATGELESSLGLTSVRWTETATSISRSAFPNRDLTVAAMPSLPISSNTASGQPAKPFLKPAKSASKKQCVEAISSL